MARRIGEDEVVLIAAPELARRFPDGAKLTATDMEQIPLILREPGSGTRAAALTALEKSGAAVDRLDIVLEVGDNVAVKEAALRGIGAAFLSRLAVEESLRSGRIAKLAFRAARSSGRSSPLARGGVSPLSRSPASSAGRAGLESRLPGRHSGQTSMPTTSALNPTMSSAAAVSSWSMICGLN
jgi:DNA-binding transcriptional LysR family regulator